MIPIAWRYEVRGNNADGRPTTEWREYGTYSTQAQAESHLAYCGNGIEGRVVALVRFEEAIDLIEALSLEIARLKIDAGRQREMLAQLRYIRTHLYAATVQRSPADDRIIADHIEQAYLRANEVIREMERTDD